MAALVAPAAVATDARPRGRRSTSATPRAASRRCWRRSTARRSPLDLAAGGPAARPAAALAYGAHTLAWSVVDAAGNRSDGARALRRARHDGAGHSARRSRRTAPRSATATCSRVDGRGQRRRLGRRPRLDSLSRSTAAPVDHVWRAGDVVHARRRAPARSRRAPPRARGRRSRGQRSAPRLGRERRGGARRQPAAAPAGEHAGGRRAPRAVARRPVARRRRAQARRGRARLRRARLGARRPRVVIVRLHARPRLRIVAARALRRGRAHAARARERARHRDRPGRLCGRRDGAAGGRAGTAARPHRRAPAAAPAAGRARSSRIGADRRARQRPPGRAARTRRPARGADGRPAGAASAVARADAAPGSFATSFAIVHAGQFAVRARVPALAGAASLPVRAHDALISDASPGSAASGRRLGGLVPRLAGGPARRARAGRPPRARRLRSRRRARGRRRSPGP